MVKFGSSINRRLTGVTLPMGFGLQWEPKDSDRIIANRVFNLLRDRRMMWKDFSLEIEEHCVKSAMEVRQELRGHLDNREIGADLEAKVRALQSLFRTFIDEVGTEEQFHRHMSSIGTDRLSMALGRLRALAGVIIGDIASAYQLDVPDELARIVPDEDGWFFEELGKSD
jgi:hypothetical protein